MSDDLVPNGLPTFADWLSSKIGFQLPAIPLPQTAKNADKALGRIIDAVGQNVASRVDRDTKLRQARAEAEAKIIDASGTRIERAIEHDNSLADRAISFSFGKAFIEQKNRETIAALAIEDLREKVDASSPDAASEIDDDWLNSFSDFASQKGDAQIQALWAKILSGKIRQPSLFSLKSLQLLSSIDANDAAIIHNVLSYAITSTFIFKNDKWKDIGKFITCEDLGVISGTSGMLARGFEFTNFRGAIDPKTNLAMTVPFVLAKTTIYAWMPQRSWQIPCFNLTRFGSDLLRLTSGLEHDEEYEQSFIDFLKANGGMVKKAIPIPGAPNRANNLVDV